MTVDRGSFASNGTERDHLISSGASTPSNSSPDARTVTPWTSARRAMVICGSSMIMNRKLGTSFPRAHGAGTRSTSIIYGGAHPRGARQSVDPHRRRALSSLPGRQARRVLRTASPLMRSARDLFPTAGRSHQRMGEDEATLSSACWRRTSSLRVPGDRMRPTSPVRASPRTTCSQNPTVRAVPGFRHKVTLPIASGSLLACPRQLRAE